MTRICRCCFHPDAEALNRELMSHTQTLRFIASKYGVSYAGLRRHEQAHLEHTLAQSKEMRLMLNAEALAARILELERQVDWSIERAHTTDNARLVLMAVQQGRGNVELLTKLALDAEIERRLAALEEAQHANGTEIEAAPDAGGDERAARLRALPDPQRAGD